MPVLSERRILFFVSHAAPRSTYKKQVQRPVEHHVRRVTAPASGHYKICAAWSENLSGNAGVEIEAKGKAGVGGSGVEISGVSGNPRDFNLSAGRLDEELRPGDAIRLAGRFEMSEHHSVQGP
jgi:hypothetical protein